MKIFSVIVFLISTSIGYASVCFSPQQNCERQILRLIYSAKQSIRMQAYSFTSYRIARALAEMQRRGVDVAILLDKSQFQCGAISQRRYLQKHGVPVYEDYQPSIAHNKVIIVDGQVVQTGSYNYTASARRYNAENVLILKNDSLAKQYLENWKHRRELSKRVVSRGCWRIENNKKHEDKNKT